MFNVCAEAVIRKLLWRMIDKEAAHGRFAGSTRKIVVFFVDNRLLGSRDPVWLQSALNVLVTLFESISLRTNPDKMKVMMCVPGNIRVAHMEEVYHTQQYGPVIPTATAKCYWVECDICGMSLAVGSLHNHMKMQHKRYWSFVFNWELTIEHEAVVFQASTDATGTIFCPVLACVGVVGSKAALQSHFLLRHPSGVLPMEVSLLLLQCNRCGFADLVHGQEWPTLQHCHV
jgi:hypothetical protein